MVSSMPQPSPGTKEPRLERRDHVNGVDPLEEMAPPDEEQLERVADYLPTLERIEDTLTTYYSVCQRLGVAEALAEIGDEEEEYVILKDTPGEGYQVEDSLVPEEFIETATEQLLPKYRQFVYEELGKLYQLDEDGSDSIYEPLREVNNVMTFAQMNESELVDQCAETDDETFKTITTYVENRKGQGQLQKDTLDEFVTRGDQYAMDKLLGDVETIATMGKEGLEQIGEEYRVWGIQVAQTMEERRRVRRSGDETIQPWKYAVTKTGTEEQPDYIK